MIIQCDQCQAKYRIDDAKVGEKGVKVRCTKCQNSFIVKKEAPSEATAPVEAAAPPPPPPPPSPPPEPEQPAGFSFDVATSKPSEDAGQGGGQAFGLTDTGEGFGGFGVEEKKEEAPSGGFGGFGVEEKKEEPPSARFGVEEKKEEVPSGGFGGFGVEEKKEEAPSGGFTFGEAKPTEEPSSGKPKEGGFGFEFEVEKEEPGRGKKEETVTFSIGAPSASGGAKPADKAGEEAPDKKAMFAGFGMGEEKAGEKAEIPSMEEALKILRPAPVSEAGSRKGLLTILLVVLILGGGFALYSSGLLSPVIRMFSKPAAVQTLEMEGVKTSFVTNVQFGQVFVIEGVVVNLSDGPQGIKFVKGVIYDNKKQPVAEKAVSAGRKMSVEELTKLSKGEIERYFSDTSPGAVPPKGTIPVMVVFTELPSGMAEAGIDIVR